MQGDLAAYRLDTKYTPSICFCFPENMPGAGSSDEHSIVLLSTDEEDAYSEDDPNDEEYLPTSADESGNDDCSQEDGDGDGEQSEDDYQSTPEIDGDGSDEEDLRARPSKPTKGQRRIGRRGTKLPMRSPVKDAQLRLALASLVSQGNGISASSLLEARTMISAQGATSYGSSMTSSACDGSSNCEDAAGSSSIKLAPITGLAAKYNILAKQGQTSSQATTPTISVDRGRASLQRPGTDYKLTSRSTPTTSATAEINQDAMKMMSGSPSQQPRRGIGVTDSVTLTAQQAKQILADYQQKTRKGRFRLSEKEMESLPVVFLEDFSIYLGKGADKKYDSGKTLWAGRYLVFANSYNEDASLQHMSELMPSIDERAAKLIKAIAKIEMARLQKRNQDEFSSEHARLVGELKVTMIDNEKRILHNWLEDLAKTRYRTSKVT